MKLIATIIICLSLLAGCATVGRNPDQPQSNTPTNTVTTTKSERIRVRADRMAVIGGKIIKRAGPLVAAGVCIAAPEYCVAAKAAYKAANVTVTAIHAAKGAEDGLKLAALGEEFVKNVGTINEVLAATGQEPIDLAEFQATVKEINAETAQ